VYAVYCAETVCGWFVINDACLAKLPPKIVMKMGPAGGQLRVKTKYGSGRGIPPLRMISYAVTGRQAADGKGILVKLDSGAFPEP